jgi:hypothetical protein
MIACDELASWYGNDKTGKGPVNEIVVQLNTSPGRTNFLLRRVEI